MSTINIKYGKQKPIKQFEVPAIQLMKLNANSLLIIKNMVQSTDSEVWLVEAQDNIIKNG